jgi:hypothetical protein
MTAETIMGASSEIHFITAENASESQETTTFQR